MMWKLAGAHARTEIRSCKGEATLSASCGRNAATGASCCRMSQIRTAPSMPPVTTSGGPVPACNTRFGIRKADCSSAVLCLPWRLRLGQRWNAWGCPGQISWAPAMGIGGQPHSRSWLPPSQTSMLQQQVTAAGGRQQRLAAAAVNGAANAGVRMLQR